jgi:hypothetical protein
MAAHSLPLHLVLAESLDAALTDVSCERACILALVGQGIRAAIVSAGIDEAIGEVRRCRALRDGSLAASSDVRLAA